MRGLTQYSRILRDCLFFLRRNSLTNLFWTIKIFTEHEDCIPTITANNSYKALVSADEVAMSLVTLQRLSMNSYTIKLLR